MRDTTLDTDRITRIWRWIHNNIPGEPSTAGEDPADVVIRLLTAEHTARLAAEQRVEELEEQRRMQGDKP